MIIILFLVSMLDSMIFGELSDYNYDFLTYALTVLVSVAAIAHVFLLTAAISNDAKRKSLSSRIIWTFLTFVFGLPVAVLYALFTFRAGKYSNRKENKKTIISGVTAILLFVIFCFGSDGVIECMRNYESTHFPAYIETYKNSDGEEFIYDKMGKEYSADAFNDIFYYDAFGNSYITSADSGCIGYKCIETGKFYPSSIMDAMDIEKDYFVLKSFLINENGFVSIMDSDDITYETVGVYSDKDNKHYYEPYLCSWDSKGNLVLSKN